jgi:hypothetical protein
MLSATGASQFAEVSLLNVLFTNGCQEPLFSGFESAVLISPVCTPGVISVPIRPIGRTGTGVAMDVPG